MTSFEKKKKIQVLVIGSGPGGAVTAMTCAENGMDVLLLEEGAKWDRSDYGDSATQGMRRLYRNRGMTPIVGKTPIGYVEGRCYGGSSEINSGFWHRTPNEILLRWKARYDLQYASPEEMEPYFGWAENQVTIEYYRGDLPPSTRLFKEGVEAMGWSAVEVPRMASSCSGKNRCASGCPTDAKRSMSRTLLPKAEAMGVTVITNCRVKMILRSGRRAVGVLAGLTRSDGSEELVRIDAEHVFVCCGPTETPALLRRSGIRYHVGASFNLHPMLKVSARFNEPVNSHETVLPLVQIKEFWPEISLGGAYFSPGHLALNLSENGLDYQRIMEHYRSMATYYVAVRGSGKGSVHASLTTDRSTHIRYELSHRDMWYLSQGFARLCMLLLAAGATELYPTVHGQKPITTELEAVGWLDRTLPKKAVSLTTVHGFCACPMGERQDRCAVDSFGRVRHFENLRINDASMLPDSPGVNPQGSIMGFARRNALHFVKESS